MAQTILILDKGRLCSLSRARWTDEDEALVRLGAALHAAEQLVHQIQRRHALQVRRRRGCHRRHELSPFLGIGSGGGGWGSYCEGAHGFLLPWISRGFAGLL
uniref:Uncharacterized protein n=1 Tax=Arundo donax TaxID=35708 RepID=A0A0A9AQ10_ARUDO